MVEWTWTIAKDKNAEVNQHVNKIAETKNEPRTSQEETSRSNCSQKLSQKHCWRLPYTAHYSIQNFFWPKVAQAHLYVALIN